VGQYRAHEPAIAEIQINPRMGNPLAFLLAIAVVIVWVASGPFLNQSDTWQLVVNTGTKIVTFLTLVLDPDHNF
jgi:low affinity Fe/Cu permease